MAEIRRKNITKVTDEDIVVQLQRDQTFTILGTLVDYYVAGKKATLLLEKPLTGYRFVVRIDVPYLPLVWVIT